MNLTKSNPHKVDLKVRAKESTLALPKTEFYDLLILIWLKIYKLIDKTQNKEYKQWMSS